MQFKDYFLSLLPINLLEWSSTIPELALLQKTEQNKAWHGEGNVLIHTNMVLEKILPVVKQYSNQEDAVSLYIASLLHDFGKITHTTTKEDGTIVAYGHEGAGVHIAREFLRQYFPEFNYPRREWILSFVEYHGHPKRLAKDDSKAIEYYKLSLASDTKMLYDLEVADFTGRIGISNDTALQLLEKFKTTCEALGIFGNDFMPNFTSKKLPRQVQNTLRWYTLTNKKITDNIIDDELQKWDVFCKQPFALVLPIGCPGSGKSTYLETVYPHIPQISMDEERLKLCGTMEDMSKNTEVFNNCFKELCSFLANKQSVVWDATSTSRKTRAKLIDCARRYGAQIIMVTFDIPKAVALERNAKRARHVPEHIIERFYTHLQFPAKYEYDILNVVDTKIQEEMIIKHGVS